MSTEHLTSSAMGMMSDSDSSQAGATARQVALTGTWTATTARSRCDDLRCC